MLVELSGKPGDVPDRVLIQVVLELLFEAGEIVGGYPLVELAVLAGRAHGIVKLGRLGRVLCPEATHGTDDA